MYVQLFVQMEQKRKIAKKQGKDAIEEDDPEKVNIVLVPTNSYTYTNVPYTWQITCVWPT